MSFTSPTPVVVKKTGSGSINEADDGDNNITPQFIADFDYKLKLQREKITLFQRPLKTISLFTTGLCFFITKAIKYCLLHPISLYCLIPIICLWRLQEDFPGPYTKVINDIEFGIEFVVWWVGLGILSSIGLGSGLQSGILFLYPHIIKVCLAAQTCKTLDFESNSNMWFRSPKNLFKCPALTHESTPVTFFGIWKKIILVCFLQAAGTAIGEIPPYWMTRAARLAAIEAGEDDSNEVPEELEAKSTYAWINKGKAWMISFLNTHGFYGVLIMASYPNIAFDLCGVCCGHFLMPFSTFFSATFIGKAIIRNGYQSIIYVTLCTEKYLDMIIVFMQNLVPDTWHVDQAIREILEDNRASFTNGEQKESSTTARSFMFYWSFIMGLLLLTFILSCVSQFAQSYQLSLDIEESNKLRVKLPSKVLLDIMSPLSGRLRLPPPTPFHKIASAEDNSNCHATAAKHHFK